MKAKRCFCLISAALAAHMMIMPVWAEEAQAAATEAAAEAATEADLGEPALVWESSSDLENGIFTVYIKSNAGEKEGCFWTLYSGDKGDATLYELLTQSTDEEGLAYVGSFRAMEGESGEDYIRIVHTNGFSVDEYMDFNIRIEDGEITEHTGGSHALPTTDQEFASVLSGAWEAEDGSNVFLSLSLNPAGGFDGVVSDAGGRDGMTELYSFRAEYDVIAEAFIYQNGAFTAAKITDGSETESEDAAGDTEGAGNGLIAFDPASESPEDLKLIFHDLAYAEEDIIFVRAK